MGLFDKMKEPVFLKEATSTREHLEKLEELAPKVDPSMKKQIEKEIKLLSIGLFGEDNIAFELKNSGMPMYIMRDMYIEANGLSAQIDYIIVTRKINFVVECKNLIGDIDIDREGNFIRKYNLFGKPIKEGIYSPVTQNERHLEVIRQKQMERKGNILEKAIFNKFFDTTFQSLVVLANPKSVLNVRYANKDIKKQVIRADQLNRYIKDKLAKSKEAPHNDKNLEQEAKAILSMHQKKEFDYSKYVMAAAKTPAEKPERKVESTPATKEVAKPNEVSKGKGKAVTKTFNKDSRTEIEEKLKAFRLQKSREEKIKPYYVFNNKQMEDLISKNPKDKKALLKVDGFGPKKVEKYGKEILGILITNG
ncbi:HRDC domain-containing protein [Isachenkonia alkalipeptolytica]|uniref:Helicase n=1 Tax=Isachenkonia alkalipeptolytica TaxID=2565777 RepID=A0AA43XKW6_9CLOT|nr:HRDC domain-containing protein [Isachenkonia alkalipeptolytica]NBG88134.1 helicase [Isachenkonia alkalipeptolytica]